MRYHNCYCNKFLINTFCINIFNPPVFTHSSTMFTLKQTSKDYSSFILVARWSGWLPPRLGIFIPAKDTVSIEQVVKLYLCSVCERAKMLAPKQIWSPALQPKLVYTDEGISSSSLHKLYVKYYVNGVRT